MLTPDVVKSKKFDVSGRNAYSAGDVDAFFAEVSASYEQMFRENGELIKKISILANKVEQYKEEEDSLRKALVSAQMLADKIVKDARDSVKGTIEKAQADSDAMRAKAEAEAQEIVDKAKAEADAVIMQSKKDADEILGAVNRKVMKESLEFEMLQKKAAEFRTNLLGLYKEHLQLINAIPEYVEKEMPQPEEPAQEEAAVPEAEETAPEAPTEEETAEVETEAEESQPQETAAEEAQQPSAEVEEEPVQETLDSVNSETAADTVEETFEDITSSSDTETSLFDDADDDGFSLDLSALEEEDPMPAEPVVQESAPATPVRAYATIEDSDSAEDADDEDDDPGSFKSFFKKK